ncbi:MAG: SUMF1/EgtB/PvdO family nonheme iron enzyme [Bacteroidetes bacterium]|nr:SUMF1/EgtB/PvdO family nonheme iron enzyme [Bacteroidota bacterium]
MKKLISLSFLLVCILTHAFANNVTTSNVFLTGQNAASDFSLINYSITWENSWRTSTNENNYDGCWIFAKFRKVNSDNWQHATINYAAPGTAVACGHTQPAGSTIQTPADGKGIWMYRSANGQGTVNWANARIRWNYGVDGVLDNDSVEIRLFAVEMVYCPQSVFNLGSGGSETYHFRDGAVDTYFPITSENSIACGPNAGNLWTSSGGTYWFTGTLPAAYPKGYKAVWCMKYEVSQQQYVDFLNTIDYNKYVNKAPLNNYNIAGTHPNLTAANPERAMSYISCNDILSILDWSALRPFSELEYEKICRGGNQVPIANEYAWGNTTINDLASPTNQGTSTETWATGNCNFGTGTGSLPIRCGALATNATGRTASGATYYGVMEMSGNIWEWAVSAADVTGRAFDGSHGDGYLLSTGEHNMALWPSAVSGAGWSIRGGGYYNAGNISLFAISDRYYGSYSSLTKNAGNYGGRGCRTGE